MKCKSFSVNFINDPKALDGVINEWLEEEKIAPTQVLELEMTSNFMAVESKKLFEGGDESMVPVQNVTVMVFYKSKKKASKKNKAEGAVAK